MCKNLQYKNNGKTKVLKAYNSQTKSDRHKVLILFWRALSGSINNFEFSLKNFDDDVTVNGATLRWYFYRGTDRFLDSAKLRFLLSK